MALSYVIDAPDTGACRIHNGMTSTGDLTLDASYLTNGWVLAPSLFGMYNQITSLNVESFHTKYWFDFDKTNQKLRAFERKMLTGATAPAAQTSGALLVDNASAPAETVVRTSGTAASTAYDTIHKQEAAASDAALNGIVLRCRVE